MLTREMFSRFSNLEQMSMASIPEDINSGDMTVAKR